MSSEDDMPLPEGWSRGFSKSQQRTFYVHSGTKHTQWHFPTVSEAKDPEMAKRRAEMNKERQELSGGGGGGSGSGGSDNRKHPPPTSSSSSGAAKRPRVEGPTLSSSSAAAAAAAAARRSAKDDDDFLALDSSSVAIIVPYRDLHAEQKRAAHLRRFVPHMIQFLSKLKAKGLVSNFHVYIVEQSDDGRKFNRGKLLNIGFDLARKSPKKHDVFIFHDVDLLPQDDLGTWYAKFPVRPIHIARVWDRYSNNPKYFGGVVSFSKSDYNRINGYPNTFWGWGGEDDEMQRRLERLGIQFDSPDSGTLVDLEEMSLEEKLNFLRKHREWKCMVKWEAADEHEKTWKTNGMADLKYSVLKQQPLDDHNNSTKATVDVKLNANHWSNDKCGVDYRG